MTQASNPDPLIAMVPQVDGQRMLGPCRLMHRIGAGAMGLVYKGHHTKLDIEVAVKIMAPHLAGDASAVARFVREAQIVARIRHANLVQIYDVDSAHGLHYIIMEWIEGHSAHDELKQIGKFSTDQALRVIHQAALGLAVAHERGYVHRDIKPANILLGMGGEIKVVDLGVAKILQENHSETGLTATGATVGTPAFMSPEQCTDSSQCGPPSDVYSLAATLFTLLTGKPPYEGKNVFEICMAVVTKPFPELAAPNLKLPKGLAAVMKKSTAKNPAERYPDAMAYANAVGELLGLPPVTASRTTSGVSAPAGAKPAGGRNTRLNFEAGDGASREAKAGAGKVVPMSTGALASPAAPETPGAGEAGKMPGVIAGVSGLRSGHASGSAAEKKLPVHAAAAPTSELPKQEAEAAEAEAIDPEAVWADAKAAERQNEMEKSWTLLDTAAKKCPDDFELNFRAADLVLRMKWKERFPTALQYAQRASDLGAKDRDQSYNSRRVLAGLQALKRTLEQFEQYIATCDKHFQELRIEEMKQPLAEAENLQPKHADMDRAKAQYEAGQRFLASFTAWLGKGREEQWPAALAAVQPIETFAISHPNPLVQKSFALLKQVTQTLGGVTPLPADGSFVMAMSHLNRPVDLLTHLDTWRPQAATSAFKRLRDFVEAGGDLGQARKILELLRGWAAAQDKRLASFETWFGRVNEARAGRKPGELMGVLSDYVSWVHQCAFAIDGTVLATGSDDHKLYLHDIPSCTPRTHIDFGKKSHITVCEPARGQKAVVVGLNTGELHQYDCETGTEAAVRGGGAVGGIGRLFGLGNLGSRGSFYNGHKGEIALVKFAPDGLALLSTAQDHTLRLFDAFNGQELKRFSDSKAAPVGLDFAATGQQAYLADEKGLVFIYDLATGTKVSQFTVGRPVKKVVFGATVAVVLDTAGKISLWDIAKGKQTQELPVKGAAVQDVVLTPNREFLLTVSRETVARLWKTETGTPVGEYAGHANALRSGAFSDTGRWLITYGMQGEARVWETATGHEMYILKGHTGMVLRACFSPDQRWIATVSEDNTARVWSAGLPPDAPQI